jgi:hypothetical protein
VAPYVTRWRLRAFERNRGLAIEPDEPDQRAYLRLRRAQVHAPPLRAQALGEHREVDHERRIREAQIGEIDPDVTRRMQRGGQRTTPQSGRRPVLVPTYEQHHLL